MLRVSKGIARRSRVPLGSIGDPMPASGQARFVPRLSGVTPRFSSPGAQRQRPRRCCRSGRLPGLPLPEGAWAAGQPRSGCGSCLMFSLQAHGGFEVAE